MASTPPKSLESSEYDNETFIYSKQDSSGQDPYQPSQEPSQEDSSPSDPQSSQQEQSQSQQEEEQSQSQSQQEEGQSQSQSQQEEGQSQSQQEEGQSQSLSQQEEQQSQSQSQQEEEEQSQSQSQQQDQEQQEQREPEQQQSSSEQSSNEQQLYKEPQSSQEEQPSEMSSHGSPADNDSCVLIESKEQCQEQESASVEETEEKSLPQFQERQKEYSERESPSGYSSGKIQSFKGAQHTPKTNQSITDSDTFVRVDNDPSRLTCHKHRDEPLIHVIAGKKKVGKQRIVCSECYFDDSKDWEHVPNKERVVMLIKDIITYQQQDSEYHKENLINNTAWRVENAIPKDAKIIEETLKVVESFRNKEESQKEQVHSFFDSLLEKIRRQVEGVKTRGQSYYDSVRQDGENLEEKYYSIINTSVIGDLVKNRQIDSQELEREMAKIIASALNKSLNDRESKQLNQRFKDNYGLHTWKIFDDYSVKIYDQINQVTFDKEKTGVTQVRFPNLNSYSDQKAVVASVSEKRLPNCASVKDNETKESKFDMEVAVDESIEFSLLTEQQYEGIAKAYHLAPLNANKKYQWVFEVYIPNLSQFQSNRNNFVLFGLSSDDTQINKIEYEMTVTAGNEHLKGCCETQYGNPDLNTFTSERTVIVMNVCIQTNTIYFTDLKKSKKNIMKIPVSFNPETNYYLFLAAQGPCSINQVSESIK